MQLKPSQAHYYSDAESYERLLVTQRFGQPAKDLVELSNLKECERVLDIGTGTGAVLFAAGKAMKPKALVTGIDLELDMLNIAKSKGAKNVILGKVQFLPFHDKSYDAVLSSFVLSHIPDYNKGLLEIVRVLKSGGKLCLTTWREGQKEYNELWGEVEGVFFNKPYLQQILKKTVPWEEWFENLQNLCSSLENVGLTEIETQQREYRVPMNLADYLICREHLLGGKLMRRILSNTLWKEFQSEMYKRFKNKFGEHIEYISQVNFAIATKP